MPILGLREPSDPRNGIKRNQKESETITKLIIEGKWHNSNGKGKIQGWINHPNKKCKKDNPYFRSFLELFSHIRLNEWNDVEWYENEPFSIPYVLLDGTTHRYVVDFAVKYTTNDKIHLIEVKPNFKRCDEKVLAKENAANVLAETSGIIYTFWDEHDIAQFGYQLEEVLKLEYVRLNSNES